MDIPDKINRFTTLPFLMDALERRRLFMPDYASWEDRNDTLLLDRFKREIGEREGIRRIRALCFTYRPETIHHWKYFANGPSGCCVEFAPQPFLESLAAHGDSIRHGAVRYLTLDAVRRDPPRLEELPFVKRYPFRVESEYRVLHLSKEDASPFELAIDLGWIRRITLAAEVPDAVVRHLRGMLGGRARVYRSTLLRNDRFLSLACGDVASKE